MSIRYIDIDSTYRNRKEWPSPAEFTIPISRNGSNPPCQAIDPVCLSAPIVAWKTYNFNIYNDPPPDDTSFFLAFIENSSKDLYNPINTENTFTIRTPNYSESSQANRFRLQKDENYYQGANVNVSDNTDTSYKGSTRVVSYKFIRTLDDTTTGMKIDYAQISVSNPIRINCYESTISAELQSNPLHSLNGPGILLKVSEPSNVSNICYPIIFVPSGRQIENAYPNYYICNQDFYSVQQIINYSSIVHTVELAEPSCQSLNAGTICSFYVPFIQKQNFCIRKELPSSVEYIKNVYKQTKIILFSKKCFDCAFVRIISNQPSINEMRRIIRICNNIVDESKPPEFSGNGFEIESPFNSDVTTDTLIEILPISYDNANPFRYDGTWMQTESYYEVSISNLVLPNAILNVFTGGNVSFYPYIYVELSSASYGENLNNTYTNNPNCNRALFRITIYDTTNPYIRPFVLLNSAPQIVKFKPNDDIKFAVRMENGELFQTVLKETYSPLPPNSYCQIRAVISLRKL
jgi:hypothetical protein